MTTRATWWGTAAAVVVVVAGCLLGQAAGAASAYTLEPTANGMQLKTPDGRIVWEYLTRKPEGIGLTSPSAACFHPVNTPSGETITSIAPDDHPHHRGIFFGWQDSEFREPANFDNYGPNRPQRGWNLRRADFWGWGEYSPREGRVVQNRDIKLVKADMEYAEVEIHNDWLVPRDRKMLDETDTVAVRERDGVFVLDFDYRLTPAVDYFLDRSAFGGFDVQCRKDGESYYTNAKGKVTLPDPHYSAPELNWPAADWYGYVITLRNGKTLGAVVVDHPRNPASTWHNSSHLWMLNPTITGGGPITIQGGATLRLRYRVIVHDGATPAAKVETLAAEFRRQN
jgi:hypothetical protein